MDAKGPSAGARTPPKTKVGNWRNLRLRPSPLSCASRPFTGPILNASWLNAVEGFFATLTKRRLKRGVFRSVADLQAAINRFLDEHNQQSRPFA